MKILFVGYAISPDLFSKTIGASAAANNYQIGLLSGLKHLLGDDLTVITRLPIAKRKASGRSYIPKSREDVTEEISTMILPMLNIAFVKQLWVAIAAVVFLAKWHRKHRGADKAVIQYNLNSFLGLFTTALCRLLGIPVVYLFTDPPYATKSRNALLRLVYRLNSAFTRSSIRHSNGIITVNGHAATMFAPEKPFCIVEGGVFCKEGKGESEATLCSSPTLVYCGGLSAHNGLENLIDGFMLTDDKDFRLRIYGRGLLEQPLKDRANSDGRILFMGFLPPDQMTAVQQNATVLVNPRPTSLEVSQTTFPSKIMEYLYSGTPLLTTRLNGILPEYHDFLYFVDDETPHGWADAITQVLNTSVDELRTNGARAREFVCSQKNWDIQGERVAQFVSLLIRGVANKTDRNAI